MCTVPINMKYTHKMLILTHKEVTNTMSTVYTTLDYEYKHKNKGTSLVLVAGKLGCTNETNKATLRCVQYTEICESCSN